jgi:tetratricopeptide (TPR) repeat protein
LGTWAAHTSRYPILTGLGLPAGILLGIGGYILIILFVWSLRPQAAAKREEDTGWAVALLAAVIGHLIEIHMGFPTVTTLVIFWILAALLACRTLKFGYTEPSSIPPDSLESNSNRYSPWPVPVTTAMLGTFAFSFYSATIGRFGIEVPQAQERAGPIGFIAVLSVVLLPTLAIGILTGWLALSPGHERYGNPRSLRRVLRPGTAAIMAVLICFGGTLWALQKFGGAIIPATGYWQTAAFYVFIYVILSASTLSLFPSGLPVTGSTPRIHRLASGLTCAGVLVLALTVCYIANGRSVLAGILAQEGNLKEKFENPESAVRFYEQAVRAQPRQAYYHAAVGQAWKAAGLATPGPKWVRQFEKSEGALLNALDLMPYDPRNWVHLGRLYSTWSLFAPPPEQSKWREKALAFFREAVRRAPHHVDIRNVLGQHLANYGDLEAAQKIWTASLEIDPDHGPTYLLLGELYISAKNWLAARKAYGRAIELMPRSVEAHSGYGYACIKGGDQRSALEAYRAAVSLSPRNHNDHKNLALLYQGYGEIEQAISYAVAALRLAPVSRREALADYLQTLRRIQGQEANQPGD